MEGSIAIVGWMPLKNSKTMVVAGLRSGVTSGIKVFYDETGHDVTPLR